jgi:phospholipid/cholesterol/gamma-HCH transport system ATP-binding protein
MLAIAGDSGAGKSVLLKLAATLLRPDAGQVAILGRSPAWGDNPALRTLRNAVGMQFQNLGLFQFLNVHDNLAFALRKAELPEPEVRTRVERRLEELGLAEAAYRFPDEISGGMKRRLAIGRVLVKQPTLALFDDPAAGLDPFTTERVLSLINEFRKHSDAAVVVAAADVAPVLALADRALALRDGRLEPLPEGAP